MGVRRHRRGCILRESATDCVVSFFSFGCRGRNGGRFFFCLLSVLSLLALLYNPGKSDSYLILSSFTQH